MPITPLSPGELEQLRRISTCVVASAIESFRLRLPNTGFVHSSIRCMFPERAPIAGYAATARIRSASPPMESRGHYYERTDWWNHILSVPQPRVVVIQDMDSPPGLGAFVGEVNASILLALGCVGMVTNGAIRDLNEVQLTRFQVFAGNVSVSHAYAHVFDFGGTVEVGGVKIKPGDLLHGDRNGVQTVPLEIAPKLPAAAHEIILRRQRLIGLCRSNEFTLEKLRQAIAEPDPKP